MLVDYLTAAAVADHLRQRLVGARVQNVVQANRLTLTFELFAGDRQYLTVTADPAREGIALSDAKARRGDDPPSPLFQAARARLVGARLTGVEQPAYERILILTFTGAEPWRLVAELTGRMANLILLNPDETVRVAARRVTAKMSGVRQIAPGRPYQLPPAPSGKVTVEELSVQIAPPSFPRDEVVKARVDKDAEGSPAVSKIHGEPDRPAWELLVASIRGVSPLLAKEAVHRLTGKWPTPAAELDAVALVAALNDLMSLADRGAWNPSVAHESASGRVVAYAPYRLTHLEGMEDRASIFAALAAYEASSVRMAARVKGALGPEAGTSPAFRTGLSPSDQDVETLGSPDGGGDHDRSSAVDAYSDARRGVAQLVAAAEGKLRRRLAALEREVARETDAERLKLAGDLLLSYQWQVKKGDRRLEVAFDPDQPPTVIALDPALSPVANAEQYFERYKKSRRARRGLPERIDSIQQQLDGLGQLGLDLDLATTRPAIDAVYDALLDGGFVVGGRRRLPKSAAPTGPLSVISADGFTLWVGRNSRQNEMVTFKKASRDDLWLHTAEVPGGHVVIKSAGRPVPESTVREAAALAVRFSKARSEAHVPVLVAEARHVRRVSGGAPGQVTVKQSRTVVV